ncbi:Transposase [Congregibacter litoralis KT71]|uniref:Transposase n=2 Tax=Congregibacter TaxID=393661 RepID=A4A510_9GAMM|nr:Transposase [Congregibacter litoralis KT71]
MFFITKYSFDDKCQIIDYHLATGDGARRLSRRFGVGPSHIRNWLSLYQHHGYEGLTKRSGHFSVAFKTSVLSKMRAESWSAKTASAHFGIASPSTVATWAKRFAQAGEAGLSRRPKRMKRKRPKGRADLDEILDKPVEEMTAEELREELLYRRAETDYLKKLEALVREQRSDENNDR